MAISAVGVSLIAQGTAKGAIGIFNFFESLSVAKDIERATIQNAVNVSIDQEDFFSTQRNSAGGRGVRRTGSQIIAERINIERGKENIRNILETGFDQAKTTRKQGFVNMAGSLVGAGGDIAAGGGRSLLEQKRNQLDFGSPQRFQVPGNGNPHGLSFNAGSLRG